MNREEGSRGSMTRHILRRYGDAVEVGNSEQVAWHAVKQCTDTTQTACDLTEQTYDMDEGYYARVRVTGPNGSSDWTETNGRFRPMSETTLGPPQMEVVLTENHLQVSLKGPFRWRAGRTKGRQNLWSIFPHMVYNVSVYNNRSKHMHFFLLTNGSLRQGPLDFDSEYCVKVESHSLSLPLASQHTPFTCVKTPRDPFTAHMLVMMLGGVVPAAVCLFVLALLGGFAYYYIHGPSEKPPQSTQDMVHISETWHMFQPEKPLIINLNLAAPSLGRGNPDLGIPGILQHSPDETECLLSVKACHLPAAKSLSGCGVTEGSHEGPYAAQNAPQVTGPETAPETASETASNTASSLWQDAGLPDDSYGLLIRMPSQQDDRQDTSGLTEFPARDASVEQLSVCEVKLYRGQHSERDAGEERYEGEEEEDEGLKLDWSPQTGVLKIPLVYLFGLEDYDQTAMELGVEKRADMGMDSELLQHEPVLTSVVVRQCSEECREEDVFTKMEEVWGLQIQSSPE